jgi:hypothetical protein
MIVLSRASFAPQKRQSWFEWSLTVAIFSARNSSMGGLHPKALVGIENIDFMYRGDRDYLNSRQRLELDIQHCQLTRPYFWTMRRWSRIRALYRSIWPASLNQL